MNFPILNFITDQSIISSLMVLLILLFIWGKLRYDAVALIMLALFVILGFIPSKEAFSGCRASSSGNSRFGFINK